MNLLGYALSMSLIASGSFWFVIAVIAIHPGLAVCGAFSICLAGMIIGHSPKPPAKRPGIFNRYALCRKIFPGTEESTGLIASYRGLRGTIEIDCRRSMPICRESTHLFLDKSEAKNLRDMLNEFLELG